MASASRSTVAARPPSRNARPTVADLAPIRRALLAALRALDDLSALTADAARAVFTAEAQRLDVARHGAELRAQVQAARQAGDALPLSALGALSASLASAELAVDELLGGVGEGRDVELDHAAARARAHLIAAGDTLDELAELLHAEVL